MKTTAVQTVGLLTYCPEMGEPRPDAPIDARLYGNHWYLTSRLELKGQGIKFLRTLTAKHLTPQAQHKVGCHEYSATKLAFKRICQEHRVASESLL